MLTGLSKKLKRFLPHTNRTVVIAVLFLIAAGVLTPQLTEAFSCGTFQFFCHIMHGIFIMIKNLAVWPLKWASAVLNWAVGGLNIGYTPDTNAVIKAGWEPVRDFANMFFIIALVIIGIATALRYKEYQAQKALPKLLIVALLINFTPALAATAINASDTAMNYFLQSGANVTTVSEKIEAGDTKTNNLVNFIDNYMADLNSRGMDSLGFVLGASTFLLLFSWGATITYFMFAALFIVRYVVLWFLIIISPLAFIAYVFPASKEKIWDPWWEQFVNWCIIVIPAAITLYLGKEVLANAHKITTEGLGNTSLGGELVQFIGMFTIPLVFLVIGYLVTLQVSAKGSEAVINGTKTAGKWGAGLAGKGLKKGVEATGAPDRIRNRLEEMRTAESVGEREERVEDFDEDYGNITRGFSQAKASAQRTIGRLGLRATQTTTEKVEDRVDNLEDEDAGERVSKVQGPTADKMGDLAEILAGIENDQLKAMKKMGLSKKKIKQAAITAGQRAPDKAEDIVKALPTIADDVAGELTKEQREKAGLTMSTAEENKYDSLTAKISADLDLNEIEGLTEETFEDKDFMKGVHLDWSGRELSKAGQEHGRDFIDPYNEERKKKGRDEEWFEEHNQGGLNYLGNDAAQGMGYIDPSEEGGKEGARRSINDLKQKYKDYVFSIQRLGDEETQKRKRMLQAMEEIINQAEKQGHSRENFLSSEIGDMEAKTPEEYREGLESRGKQVGKEEPRGTPEESEEEPRGTPEE